MKIKLSIAGIFSIILVITSILFSSCAPDNAGSQDVIEEPSTPEQSQEERLDEDKEDPIVKISRFDSIPSDAVKMMPEEDLYPPILHSDEFYEPVPMPYPVNTAGGEDSPFMMPDGKTFYVFFTPDVSVPVEKQVLDGVTGIYETKLLTSGEWSTPEKLTLNDDISLDGCAYVHGNRIWFCSVRQGYSGIHWFTADYIDGEWTDWKYSGLNMLEGYEVGELHFTSDNSELYFHSSRPGGHGGYDIWVCRNVDGDWQEPENVSVVNSPDTDGWPYISEDGSQMWFTRFYQGSPALFRSFRVNGEWQVPELIVSQFAGEPTLDNDGNLYFTHHFYKDGVMIEADIYVARKK